MLKSHKTFTNIFKSPERMGHVHAYSLTDLTEVMGKYQTRRSAPADDFRKLLHLALYVHLGHTNLLHSDDPT